jgi:acyl-CoA synthetase (NDP forming)
MRQNIAPLAGISEAINAIEAAAVIGRGWSIPQAPPVMAVPPSGCPQETLDEPDAKALLVRHGIRIPPGRRAGAISEAVAAAKALGFPVVVKALGVAHKTESGAVRLDRGSAAAVEAAASDLLPLGQGLLVERMIEAPVLELIIGFSRDPQFGLVMTIGAGGVLAEILDDHATLLLPARRSEIESALMGLRAARLLAGFRGGPRGDIAAVLQAAEAAQHLALDPAAGIEELDINPLIVCAEGKGAFVADALIVRRKDLDG